jgi:hypothetical protein
MQVAGGGVRQPWQTSPTHEPPLQPLAHAVSTVVYVHAPAVHWPGTWLARRVFASRHTAAGGVAHSAHRWPPEPHVVAL